MNLALLAHGGLINPWGLAYTGGVIGTVTTALWIARHNVALNTDAPRRARLPRWFIPVGFACGVSLGLGVGGLLERLFATTPDALGVARQLCDLTEPTDETAELHEDLDHLADDLEHGPLARAHADLHAAATTADSQAAAAAIIRQLEHAADMPAGAACAPGAGGDCASAERSPGRYIGVTLMYGQALRYCRGRPRCSRGSSRPAPGTRGRVACLGMKTELVERYRGRWVAVNDAGEVVADAEELGELLHACDGKGYSVDVAIHRVPEADAPLVVGLG